jgi:hypothetical protein
MEKGKSQTELAHSLAWYVEHYGLSLSAVQRNRDLLDHPATLQWKLLNQGGHRANLSKFVAYWRTRPRREFIK